MKVIAWSGCCAALIVAGCGPQPLAWQNLPPDCRTFADGVGTVDLRSRVAGTSGREATLVLFIRDRTDTASHTAAVIRDASVELRSAGTNRDSTGLARVAHGSWEHPNGAITFAAVRPGTYHVSVRRLGYVPVADTIDLLAGFVDTLEVRLAPQHVCLAEHRAGVDGGRLTTR